MYPESLIEVWVFILNALNPELKLQVVSEPTSHKEKTFKFLGKGKVKRTDVSGKINFYGFDSKDRHLKTPGYGVWDGDDDTRYYLDCN